MFRIPLFFIVIFKYIIYTILILGGSYIFLYLLIDFWGFHREKLIKEGLLKEKKQYYDYKPERINYNKSHLIDIRETQEYKAYVRKHKKDPNLEAHGFSAVLLTILFFSATIIMIVKILFF